MMPLVWLTFLDKLLPVFSSFSYACMFYLSKGMILLRVRLFNQRHDKNICNPELTRGTFLYHDHTSSSLQARPYLPMLSNFVSVLSLLRIEARP